jgi:hypothetical protein
VRRACLLGVGAVAVLVLVACGGENSATPPATSAPPTTAPEPAAYAVAFGGLCGTRGSAGTDMRLARTTFYDRSHDPLHSLAGDLEPVDRVLAARLLEAKEAVESGLRADRPPPSLGPDLDRLIEVTGQALARLSLPVPRCT